MDYHLSREEYRLLVEKAPIMIWRSNLTMACDYFNEVRNDKNDWEQIETYVSSHSGATFSHGICPECVTKVLAE